MSELTSWDKKVLSEAKKPRDPLIMSFTSSPVLTDHVRVYSLDHGFFHQCLVFKKGNREKTMYALCYELAEMGIGIIKIRESERYIFMAITGSFDSSATEKDPLILYDSISKTSIPHSLSVYDQPIRDSVYFILFMSFNTKKRLIELGLEQSSSSKDLRELERELMNSNHNYILEKEYHVCQRPTYNVQSYYFIKGTNKAVIYYSKKKNRDSYRGIPIPECMKRDSGIERIIDDGNGGEWVISIPGTTSRTLSGLTDNKVETFDHDFYLETLSKMKDEIRNKIEDIKNNCRRYSEFKFISSLLPIYNLEHHKQEIRSLTKELLSIEKLSNIEKRGYIIDAYWKDYWEQ